MRRFWRWMLNGLAVVSLLLCVAMIALWARSYVPPGQANDKFVFSCPATRLWDLSVYRGHFYLYVIHGWPGPQPPRWCGSHDPHAPGPLCMQGSRGGYPLGCTWSRYFGIPVMNTYYQYALNAKGVGYVSDADGFLPRRPFNNWRLNQTLMFPTYYSKGLLDQSAGLGHLSFYAIALAVVPIWMWVVPTAVTVFSRLSGRGRGLSGLCAKCGYDLRATPHRCPECGTVPKG
jgi:hypothetical protein